MNQRRLIASALLLICAALVGVGEHDASADNKKVDSSRPTGDLQTFETAPAAAKAGGAPSCPDPNMVLVEGNYCPEVFHACAHWLESAGRYRYFRCAEYTSAKCLSKERVRMSFCMDRDEWAPPGETLPASHVSWTDAKRTCEGMGKRVCLESEWNFACEGEEMRPYPYGWKRDPEACNADRVDLFRPDGKLADLRVGAKEKPQCVSPFGVHNLSGNLEEWTTIDRTRHLQQPAPAMKGAYWQPSRNHCRAAQTAHDHFYNGTETGFRCCADSEGAKGPTAKTARKSEISVPVRLQEKSTTP
jgi:hypothetical protein